MNYLILAGTNKSGTTSIFNYLGDHPQISPSLIKQTDFFRTDNICAFEDYKSLFQKKNNTLCCIEASPDYMYDKRVPKQLANCLKGQQFKIIFLLRNPVNRFLSWYKYAKQLFLIPEDMSVRTFIDENINAKENQENEAFVALKTGKYINYLKPYIDTFGQENVQIIFTEDLMEDPQSVLIHLTSLFGLDATFYEKYEFKIFNKSGSSKKKNIRKIYLGLRKIAVPLFNSNNFFSAFMIRIGKKISKLYRHVNVQELKQNTVVEPSDYKFLSDYYYQSDQHLQKLINQPLPWKE